VDGEFLVLLNDETSRLRVNILSHHHNKTGSAETSRSTSRGECAPALWLIRSIEQRQRTLFKVASPRDSAGFWGKESRTRPLTLKGGRGYRYAESTVSRVTTNKYVRRQGFSS
jgi:RNA polymerase sigma-54 factor